MTPIPEDKSRTFFRTVGRQLPNHMMQHPQDLISQFQTKDKEKKVLYKGC
jgi:hypothetical protein